MLTELAFLWLVMAVAGYGFAFQLVWRRFTRAAEHFCSIGDAGLAGLHLLNPKEKPKEKPRGPQIRAD